MMTEVPKLRCCTPSSTEVELEPREDFATNKASAEVKHSLVDIIDPEFLMGDAFGEGYLGDGEGPQRLVKCSSFRIGTYAVTNGEFSQFVNDANYITDAEKFGWSFVFYNCLSPESRTGLQAPADTPWWLRVDGACWATPEGPESTVTDRSDHPVTHLSWFDAKAYCHWAGARLPTEAEWECAARGKLVGNRYAWGNNLESEGKHFCNIWQGAFPEHNSAADGYLTTAPVSAFKPNGHGLYNVCGNVWEWCEDWFTPNYHCITESQDPNYTISSGNRSMRGGSFLCHDSYCNRYRVAARSFNVPDSTTNHCGFRIVIGI